MESVSKWFDDYERTGALIAEMEPLNLQERFLRRHHRFDELEKLLLERRDKEAAARKAREFEQKQAEQHEQKKAAEIQRERYREGEEMSDQEIDALYPRYVIGDIDIDAAQLATLTPGPIRHEPLPDELLEDMLLVQVAGTPAWKELLLSHGAACVVAGSIVPAVEAIVSERAYQDSRWGDTGSSGREGNGERTLDEFVLYIKGYADDLVHVASHTGDADEKLEFVRKVAALCCAAMEQHGAPRREGF